MSSPSGRRVIGTNGARRPVGAGAIPRSSRQPHGCPHPPCSLKPRAQTACAGGEHRGCLIYCYCALCCPGEGLSGALAEAKSGALCLGVSTSYSEQRGLAGGAHASRYTLLVSAFLHLVQLFWGKEIVCCKHNVHKGQRKGHHFKNMLLSTPVRDSKH